MTCPAGTILAFSLALSPVASAGSAGAVRLATLAPRGTSYHQALLALREEWRLAPGGGVPLVLYTDGTMGGEADMVSRIRVGQLQAALLTGVGLAELDASVQALHYMPMMYRSLEEMEAVRGRIQARLEKRLLDKGIVVLFWGDAGWVRFFSKDPIERPGDLKGAKLWVWAGDTRQVDVMKSLGFHPVPLETGDMYTGLQTGMIDALSTMPFYALAQQLYQKVPHMLDLNWGPMTGALVVSRGAWESLPAEARPALLAAAGRAGEAIKARGRLENEQAVEAMGKRGLIVHRTTPETQAEWVAFAERVLYPRLIRGHTVPADLFDEVRRIVEELRTRGSAK